MRTAVNPFIQLTIILLLASSGGAAGDEIKITNLERTPEHSVHLVRIGTQEAPHYHATHDSIVVIERGGGVLFLNGSPHVLAAGDRIEIPRGVPHYFVHHSSEPFTEARVTFTPPFDGKDRILVAGPETPGKAVRRRTRAARFLEWIFRIFTIQGSVAV